MSQVLIDYSLICNLISVRGLKRLLGLIYYAVIYITFLRFKLRVSNEVETSEMVYCVEIKVIIVLIRLPLLISLCTRYTGKNLNDYIWEKLLQEAFVL
jgi:hypothetical protein